MRSHGSSPLKPSLMSQIHYLCGTSHTELGHYHDAIEHLNEAVHHVPTNASVIISLCIHTHTVWVDIFEGFNFHGMEN